MSGICTSTMLRLAVGALVLTLAMALAGPGMASAELLEEAAARIVAVCGARAHPAPACQCLSREAGSRFDTEQLEHIADALEAHETVAETGERMRRAGMPEGEVASVIHRLATAEVVIQQTCGASIFEAGTAGG